MYSCTFASWQVVPIGDDWCCHLYSKEQAWVLYMSLLGETLACIIILSRRPALLDQIAVIIRSADAHRRRMHVHTRTHNRMACETAIEDIAIEPPTICENMDTLYTSGQLNISDGSPREK